MVWGLALSRAKAGRLEAVIASFQRFKRLVSLPSHHLELTIRGEHGELSLRQMEMVLA